MLQHIKKLRGRSADELLTRSRQLISKTVERIGGSAWNERVPDGLKTNPNAHSLFAPWFADPKGFVQTLENKWPAELTDLIRRADRIASGKFDLLGYKGLEFGSPQPDWHLDPISGKRSPRIHWSLINEISADETGDKKVIWELNRHQYFVALGQAYLCTGDERYAEIFAAHLENWFAENPPKIGVNWLSSLELAFRSISWIRAYFLFDGASAFTDSIRQQMLKFLFIQARHIEKHLSTYFAPNTHITGEGIGLYYIGTILNAGRSSNRWKETGYRILMEWLPIHVRSDGSYCEQASHYAHYTADFYADLMLLRQRDGLTIEPIHKERLDSLFTFLMHLKQPDGTTPLFGDDDGGRYFPFDSRPIGDMRGAISFGAAMTGRGDLKYATGDPTAALQWINGIEGLKSFDARETEEPSDLAIAFPDGGFFTRRSSWRPDADQVLIFCGPHGFKNGGHAHADALGFTASIRGKPVFVDAGAFVYTADLEARNRYRSSDAHNCLTVDGQSSSIPAGPFSWKTQTNARLIEWQADAGVCRFRGTHDGFASLGVNYERSIQMGPGSVLYILDQMKSLKPHTYRVNFILAQGVEAEIDNGFVRLLSDGNEITMVTTGDEQDLEATWSIEEFRISPIYGNQVSTNRLVFTVPGSCRIDIETKVTWQCS